MTRMIPAAISRRQMASRVFRFVNLRIPQMKRQSFSPQSDNPSQNQNRTGCNQEDKPQIHP